MVNFGNFGSLDPEVADTARNLFDGNHGNRSPFASFIHAWLAFNGWMEAVTDGQFDADMITALAENRKLTDAYGTLLAEHPDFEERVTAFTEGWPVLNVRDARKKLGADVFFRMDRDELVEACALHGIKMQPSGWTPGDLPTWPQLLRTIYLVRCNLFHGAKSPQNGRDRDLVRQADRILRKFIQGSGCFEWRD